MVKPLNQRPLDLLYVVFFAIHIPAFFLVDSQVISPDSWKPSLLLQIKQYYVETYNDPFIGGAIGLWSANSKNSWAWIWTTSFLWLEALFQLPMFVLSIINLRKDNKGFYPWILIYAASTTTTLIPALSLVASAPVGQTSIIGVQITSAQKLMLYGSYGPFLAIPLLMTVDMALRISSMLASSLAQSSRSKLE